MGFLISFANSIYKGENVSRNVSRPAIRIATVGVAVGVAVVIISLAVVFGFKHTIRDKVVGFGSHITIANFKTLQTSKSFPIAINDSMVSILRNIDGVRHVQKYAYTQSVLKTEEDFLGVTFKGIDENFDSTFISSSIVEGRFPQFSSKVNKGKIVISKIIADKLHIKVGYALFAYFISNDNLKVRKYIVEGIYQTNLAKYDENVCFCDLYSVCKINNWLPYQVTGAELSLTNFDNIINTEDEIIRKINKSKDQYGETYCSATIEEQAPQLFSWLDLLDLNVIVILVLMLCVAGFTIISGLLIIILEKSSMIGILKALGARNNMVQRIFVYLALIIVGKGLIYGNVIGIGICLLQQHTKLVKLDPTIYYVDVAPIELTLSMIFIVNICTLAASILVLVLPSFFVSVINPARSMRYE